MREMVCCRCGKNMIDPETGNAFIGVAANIRSNSEGFSSDFIKKQAGVFQLDRDYYLCYECWLLHLGIVP
jgi:hypothetical protein